MRFLPVAFAVALVLPFSVSAQGTAPQAITVATVNIYDAAAVQAGHTFSVGFALSNREGVQPDILYAVLLLKKDADGESAAVDVMVYEDDVLDLRAGETVLKTAAYTAPASSVGTYRLAVEARSSAGLLFSHVEIPTDFTLTKTDDSVGIADGTENSSLQSLFLNAAPSTGAAIQNLTLDKDRYARGDTAHLSLFWNGTTAAGLVFDFSDPESFDPTKANSPATSTPAQTPDVATIMLSIADGQGAPCADPYTHTISDAPGNAFVQASVPITSACANPTVTASIVDEVGELLAQNSYEVTSKSASADAGMMLIALAIIPLLVAVYLLPHLIRRRRTGIAALLVLFVVGGVLGGGQEAKADTYYYGWRACTSLLTPSPVVAYYDENGPVFLYDENGNPAYYSIWCLTGPGPQYDPATQTYTELPYLSPFSVTYTISLNKTSFTPGETITAYGYTGIVTSGTDGGHVRVGIGATVNGSTKNICAAEAISVCGTSTNTFTAPSTPGTYNAVFDAYVGYYQIPNQNMRSIDSTSQASIPYTVVAPPPPQPDLSANAPTVTPSAPAPEQATTFTAAFANAAGGSGVANFPNTFRITQIKRVWRFSNTVLVGTVDAGTIASLAPGGSTSLNGSYAFAIPGTYYVQACADQNASQQGTVTESNESNNCGPMTVVTVAYAPINGACSSPAAHYTCAIGTSGSTAESVTAYTWTCYGANNGANALCSEAKATCSANQYLPCPLTSSANACDQTITMDSGAYDCSGACVGSPPSAPAVTTPTGATYNATCSVSNSCNTASNQGTIQCDGTCSVSAPANPANYGTACTLTSSQNACGQTNTSTGSIQCNGSCGGTIPSAPPNSNCSAPTVTVTVTPSTVVVPNTFTVAMTSSTDVKSCTWTRTGSYPDNWSNQPVPSPNTSYNSGALSWGAGNAIWTFTCTNAAGKSSSASGSISVANTPISGSCGSANGRTYAYGSSSYSPYPQCSSGSPSNSAFPSAGSSASWTCSGIYNGSASGPCSASQSAPASCTATTINNCSLTATASGGSAGACSTGYVGSCSYTCTNGAWSRNSNTCTLAVCTGTVPSNASVYAGDTDGFSVDTAYAYASPNTSAKCQYSCNSGYSWSGSACLADVAIGSFTNNGPIANGATASLSWSGVTGGGTITCTIDNGVGAATPAASGSKSSGSLLVNTTFILTCGNGVGPNATRSTTVSVNANQPPTAPTITGPTAGVPNTSYTYTYTSTDPEGDQLKYQIDWDNNGTVDQTLPASGWVNSGVSQSQANDWGSIGTKMFKARAVDNKAAAGTSGWTTYTVNMACASGSTWNGSICLEDPCAVTTISNCVLPATASGGSAGACSTGYSGTCSYACSKGTWTVTTNACVPIPTATLSCGQTKPSAGPECTINSGQSTKLFWTSTDATSCTAAGGFSTGGATANNSGVSVTPNDPLKPPYSDYQITCAGPGGTSLPSTARVNIRYPQVTIGASPSRVTTGGSTTVTATATNVDSCAIMKNGSAWQTFVCNPSGSVTKSFSDTNITTQNSYEITCSNDASSVTAAATQIVNVVTVFQEF